MSDMEAVLAAREAVRRARSRLAVLGDDGVALLFRDARSHNGWQDRPVSDGTLEALYEVFKHGPTSANGNPARFIFVRSPEAKEKLLPALAPGNVPKVQAAPVTAIIGYDLRFYEQLPRLFPHKDMQGNFRDNPAAAETAAFRNGTLQGAYLMIAARALGLDIGPMSGFNNAAVDAAFFEGTSIKSNFLCCLGYGDESALFERLPRYAFDEVCDIR